ncbi:GGDEF domain-containing protein [Paenibacillus eucommiae]|uniref:Diguanylate cyclase (GGDEF)-like protein n=1 Tax=Paenibacillus eucommiae TaxID=1355755 RepID=A0ABS4IXT1_9BACL|nr:GGDEF domain-containing protein [Paenibacillus eucommiae]MBP1992323.1 diguanylate cyclase (GGDEF)-like protein [Paenibacillus eucommiae]
MKYTGRIAIVTVCLVLSVIVRLYGIFYYNYPPLGFPYVGITITFIFYWLGKQYDMVKFLSEKDTLTKLYNRRYVIQTFPKLIASIDKKAGKLSLFLIDVDNFKVINDTYGHETGDRVLQRISSLLALPTDKSTIVARWAGDEFLLVAPFTDQEGADIIIQRIHKELRKSSEELRIDISVSIGTSEYPGDAQTFNDLLNIADQNMYKLKFLKK